MEEKGKRYRFMDVLRLLSMLAIVFYHMTVTLYLMGIRQLSSVRIFYENANMHIAKVGVGLFFMLSGAGLMLSGEGKNGFSVKDFYRKRFVRILIPFYIVYAAYFLYLLIWNGGKTADLFAGRGANPLSAVFTLLGMDAYLSNFGIPTYSLGIGEWFLGCLVIMYLIYPLLRRLLKRNRILFAGILLVYYIGILSVYGRFSFAASVPPFLNAAVKIFDFALGMFLADILPKIPKWTIFPALAVNAFYAVCPVTVPGNDSFGIVIQCLAVFLIFYGLEPFFGKDAAKGPMKAVSFLCKVSYEYYLIHHVVIDALTGRNRNIPFSNFDVLLLFLKEILLTAALTAVLKLILWGIGRCFLKKHEESGGGKKDE
ncbi:MAG: acyltransferase [Lachnospiraceae bacterium]|nr:acyltransferase [Lachnospiraceae bacterium]